MTSTLGKVSRGSALAALLQHRVRSVAAPPTKGDPRDLIVVGGLGSGGTVEGGLHVAQSSSQSRIEGDVDRLARTARRTATLAWLKKGQSVAEL